MPVFLPVPCCFDFCSSGYSLKSKRVIHPALFLFFLKIALAILGLLWFHMNFRIICSSSVENGKCHGYFNKSEKAMAPHSSTLAWQIPWTEEPGRLQSMGSLGVRQDWATSLSFFSFMHWRRKWQPTAMFLPGESQGWGTLVGCRLWGLTESDTTEAT